MGMRRVQSFYNSTTDTPIKSITLDRSSCHSDLCPVYTVKIDVPTKTVNYFGTKNVKKLGSHIGKLTSYQISLLIDFIETSNFFGLNREYSANQPDMQMTTITVALENGQQKSISFDEYATPAQLVALRLLIINSVNRTRWLYH